MNDINNYYLEVLTPEDECAKHGKDWMFRRKNPPSTEKHIYVSEYTYICLACLWDNIDKLKEENKQLGGILNMYLVDAARNMLDNPTEMTLEEISEVIKKANE